MALWHRDQPRFRLPNQLFSYLVNIDDMLDKLHSTQRTRTELKRSLKLKQCLYATFFTALFSVLVLITRVALHVHSHMEMMEQICTKLDTT